MKNALFLILLSHVSFSLMSYGQYDTIKVDAAISIISDKDISAEQLKKGDTTFVFKVVDAVIINNSIRQNFVVVNKGARVVGVVESSVLPFKIKGRPRPPRTEEEFFNRPGLKIGGELIINLISVQAVDGSYLPLNDCSVIQFGGEIGGFKDDKTAASIAAGRRKSCFTKYPNAVLIIRTQK